MGLVYSIYIHVILDMGQSSSLQSVHYLTVSLAVAKQISIVQPNIHVKFLLVQQFITRRYFYFFVLLLINIVKIPSTFIL